MTGQSPVLAKSRTNSSSALLTMYVWLQINVDERDWISKWGYYLKTVMVPRSRVTTVQLVVCARILALRSRAISILTMGGRELPDLLSVLPGWMA
jgi:hypothetical protein